MAVGLVHWMLLLIPGPNMFLVSHLAAAGQRRAAALAALGISMVACFWALLAMLGVQALFAALPGIRLAVQVAGGLYLLGPHRLVCGDSRDRATWETLLGGERLQMVWTDPPYGVAVNDVADVEEARRLHRRTDGKIVMNDALTPYFNIIHRRCNAEDIGVQRLATDDVDRDWPRNA